MGPMRSDVLCSMLALLLASSCASAQPASPAAPTEAAECRSQEAAIEHDMELARSNGQMLRRRQLAESLTALQARCSASVTPPVRARRIEALQKEITELHKALDQAEEELRKLRQTGS